MRPDRAHQRRRLVAEGRRQLTRWSRDYGKEPTLESVFMTFTGKSLDDDVDEERPMTTSSERKEVMPCC